MLSECSRQQQLRVERVQLKLPMCEFSCNPKVSKSQSGVGLIQSRTVSGVVLNTRFEQGSKGKYLREDWRGSGLHEHAFDCVQAKRRTSLPGDCDVKRECDQMG